MTRMKSANGVYDFTIVAKDMTGMESAFYLLPPALQNRQLGSGYDLTTGERDHQFTCRNKADADEIVSVYEGFFSKRRAKVRIIDNNTDG